MEGVELHPVAGYPMGDPVAHPSNSAFLTRPCAHNCKKRRMTEDVRDLLNHADITCNTPTPTASKNFLPLPKCDRIFHTEDWKPRGTTLFLPLLEDILVSLKTLEQISFGQGTYFVADNEGNYSRSIGGQIVNMWRYSEQDRHLYISRSFLFTHPQDFKDVQEFLQSV